MNGTFDSSFNNVLTYQVFKLRKNVWSVWKQKQLQSRMQLQAKVFQTLAEMAWKMRYEITTDTTTFDRREIVRDREIVLHTIYNRILKDRSM